jgi:D-alanyl-D-alanine carboxypeptidase (penicillin-binding protein 5/6)
MPIFIYRTSALFITIFFCLLASPFLVSAQANFDPTFIISDPELQDYLSWDRTQVQKFLDSKKSYLSTAIFEDVFGIPKTAADIITDAAIQYQINPKFLLVTLQKEQSLITDDTPSTRQLDWATGYAVCDGCFLDNPKVLKFKGFGKQVDGAAGVMRWYYQNQNASFIKQKDTPVRIDDQMVVPGSWATAFLYTYTPHLHGNQNFWRIWNTWFSELYPNGTLLQTASTNEYWLIDNGQRRHFKNKTALITRYDQKLALIVDPVDLQNYPEGPEISFPNYSLLQSGSTTYFLNFDVLHPFASDSVVLKLGFVPDEIIDASNTDFSVYTVGSTITASTTNPAGAVFQITDAKNLFYILKDDLLYPVLDPAIVTANYRALPIEKHKLKDLNNYQIADLPLNFNDGTLIRVKDSGIIYVIDHGKKRVIADDDTFLALGYKKTNIITVSQLTIANIPIGDSLFVNNSLISAKNKYLGDSETPVTDLYNKATSASYLIAEYPSGRIITGKNIDTRQPIASLSKLLTAYEALKEDYKLTKTTIYTTSTPCDNKNLQFKTGDKIKNKDLFYSMLVGSFNCAADLVARGANSDQFTFLNNINRRLEEWGADYTTIADVSGVSDKNKSTARDLLKIFTKVLGNSTIKDALSFPTYKFTEIASKDKIAYHTFKNTNQIISKIPLSKRHYSIVATKTGYAEEANNAVIMLIQPKKSKQQYIVLTIGNANNNKKFEELNNLAEWVATLK